LGSNCNFNNIQNSSQYNLALGQLGDTSMTGNVDATNNWWGTNDIQAINQTIYDGKNNSALSNIIYVPFLTEQNSAAPPQDYTVAAGASLATLTAPSPDSAVPTPTPASPTASTIPTSINKQTYLTVVLVVRNRDYSDYNVGFFVFRAKTT
jgi:hypothetical protein